MAAVFLLSTTEPHLCARLRVDARQDVFGVHHLVEDAAAADLILFAEFSQSDVYLDRVRRHPYVRQHREKCFCLSENDFTFPFLPGLYTSITPRLHSLGRVRTNLYLVMHRAPYRGISYIPPTADLPHLFSFVGSFQTHPVRARLGGLGHPRGLVVNSDVVAKPHGQHPRQFFSNALTESAFVLCPRGRAPGSVRLFQTLKAGRVPVILSDAWVPPMGPAWDTFSIRVPEADVADVPAILEARADEAVAMGIRARQAWEDWFASRVRFHRIVEWCLDIQRQRPLPEALLRATAYAHVLRAPHRADYLRSRWRRWTHADTPS